MKMMMVVVVVMGMGMASYGYRLVGFGAPAPWQIGRLGVRIYLRQRMDASRTCRREINAHHQSQGHK